MLERRTLIVLGCLLAAMTLASGWLMLLESNGSDRPMTPTFAGAGMAAYDRPRDPAEALFHTDRPVDPDRWSAIVVRFSGAEQGSASTLGALHRRAGLGELAYHFVIGNGQGSPDGQVQIGPRWLSQSPGYTAYALPDRPGSRAVIDICVIGDFQRQPPTERQQRDLIWLVRQLQQRCRIEPQRVLLGDDQVGGRNPAGRMFPVAAFRRQLLATAAY